MKSYIPVLFSVNYHGKAPQLGEFSLTDQFRAVKRVCKFNNVLFMKPGVLRMTHLGDTGKVVDIKTKRKDIFVFIDLIFEGTQS